MCAHSHSDMQHMHVYRGTHKPGTHTHTHTKLSQCTTATMRETLMSSELASDPSTQVSIICFLQWAQIGMRKKHLLNAARRPHCDHMRCLCGCVRVFLCVCVTEKRTFLEFKISNVFLDIQVIKRKCIKVCFFLLFFLLQYQSTAPRRLKVILCVCFHDEQGGPRR